LRNGKKRRRTRDKQWENEERRIERTKIDE
jgi:hypothetical protein